MAYRLCRGFASVLVDNRTLLFSNFLDTDAWDKEAEIPWFISAVLDRDLVAGLHGDFVTINHRNLVALELRNIGALLLGDWMTLLCRSLLTLSSGNILAFFLLDGVTNSFWDVMAMLVRDLATLLLGYVMALLAWHVLALLLVTQVLANLLVNSVTFLSIGSFTLLLVASLALTTMLSPTLLFGDLVALSVIDNLAVFLGNVLTYLVLYFPAFLLEDNIAFSDKVGNTSLLPHWLTLVIVPRGALLVVLCRTLFLMNSFLNILGDANTMELGGVVALFVRYLGTLLLDVIDSLAILLIVNRTDHLGGRVPYLLLNNPALLFLSISTDIFLNIVTLLSCH